MFPTILLCNQPDITNEILARNCVKKVHPFSVLVNRFIFQITKIQENGLKGLPASCCHILWAYKYTAWIKLNEMCFKNWNFKTYYHSLILVQGQYLVSSPSIQLSIDGQRFCSHLFTCMGNSRNGSGEITRGIRYKEWNGKCWRIFPWAHHWATFGKTKKSSKKQEDSMWQLNQLCDGE